MRESNRIPDFREAREKSQGKPRPVTSAKTGKKQKKDLVNGQMSMELDAAWPAQNVLQECRAEGSCPFYTYTQTGTFINMAAPSNGSSKGLVAVPCSTTSP